jgi:hypothetical protein
VFSTAAGKGLDSSATSSEDADDAGMSERSRGIEAGDPRVGVGRADDGGVSCVRHRVQVVHEAPLPSQQRLVLEPRQCPSDPGLGARRRDHLPEP